MRNLTREKVGEGQSIITDTIARYKTGRENSPGEGVIFTGREIYSPPLPYTYKETDIL